MTTPEDPRMFTPQEIGDLLPEAEITKAFIASMPAIEYEGALAIMVTKACVDSEQQKFVDALVPVMSAAMLTFDHDKMIETLQTVHKQWHADRESLTSFATAKLADETVKKAQGDGKPTDN